MIDTLSIVIPSYNEEENINELYNRLIKILDNLKIKSYEIIFVDNGSTDNSLKILKELNLKNKNLKIISLSRNFGYQNALIAGLEFASFDHLFILDGDLQDPPELLESFIKKMDEGYDIVYGIRSKRKASLFKKFCYKLFYFIYDKFSEISMPREAGEFSLINKKALEHLKKLNERNIFLRGLRTWIGLKQAGIKFDRLNRSKGNPKFSFYDSFILALDGIISFTLVPLRGILILGIFLSAISFLYFSFVLITKLISISGINIPNWLVMPKGLTIMNLIMVTFFSLIVLILGVLGEYIGKIYNEVKQRPRYIIREIIK